MAELEHDEFTRRMSFRETEESLSIQQEDMEEAYQLTQDQIQAQMKKIREAEETYKQLDQEHLKDIEDQVKISGIMPNQFCFVFNYTSLICVKWKLQVSSSCQ